MTGAAGVRVAFAALAIAVLGLACTGGEEQSPSQATPAVATPASTSPAATPPSQPAVTATPAAEAAYEAQALDIIERIAAVSESVAALLEEAEPSAEAWQSALASGLEGLRAAHAEAQQLVAPDALSAVHARLLDATGGFHEAATLLSGAVRTLDPEGFQRASEELSTAIVALAEVRVWIDEAP